MLENVPQSFAFQNQTRTTTLAQTTCRDFCMPACVLFCQLCFTSHGVYRAKFCANVFLCPMVGDLYIQLCSLYIDVAVPFKRPATKL